MSTASPIVAAPQPLFIALGQFKQYGILLGKTRAYEAHRLGLIALVKQGGRVGVTYDEARRYVAASIQPLDTAKKVIDAAVAARQAKRRAAA